MFDLFWQKIVMQANELENEEPTLPRRCKVPRRYEVGTGTADHAPSPKDHYRAIYYEGLDTTIGCISDRFKQEGYQMYCKVEQLLVGGEQTEDEVKEVLAFYGSDFENTLLSQHHLFYANYPTEKRTCIYDILSLVKGMSVGEKVFMAQVVKLVHLLL